MVSKIILSVLLLAVLVITGLQLFTRDRLVELTHLDPMVAEDSTMLVVAFHPFVGGRETMGGAREVIESVYPNADVLMPRLFDSVFTNISPTHTSAVLDERIQQLVDERKQLGRPYEKIIMVGYSMGALFLRKTYLYGLGGSVDHPLHATGNNAKEWPRLVERIVLLAGQNNGWSLDNISEFLKLKAVLGEWAHTLTGMGKLFAAMKKGSPFVVNLKLEWTRLANSGEKLPMVVQLLGNEDRVSPLESHFELMASPGFIFIPVAGTRHVDMARLGTDLDTTENEILIEYRRDLFIKALTESRAALEQDYGSNSEYLDSLDPRRAEVTRVVFVVHGIRDYGGWVSEVSDLIRDADPRARVISSRYGYFPLGRFLLLSDRQKNVRWFTDKYAAAVALYPNCKEFHFVGHSNGTYLLASTLNRYAAVKFDRVLFGGSIVRSDFPWDQYIPNRVGELKNIVADDDWVVALYPKFFQIVRKQFDLDPDGYFGLGSAGLDGFEANTGRNSEVYISGGHSAAIQRKREISDYIVSGAPPDSAKPPRQGKTLLQTISNLNWILWIVVIAVMILTARHFARMRIFRSTIGKPNAYVLYVAVLAGVIYTI